MPDANQNGIFSPLSGKLREPEFYEALGFRSGLEIHQQLLTEKKLFCRCPAGRYTRTHDAVILRHMRPTLSELGEYDGTALMEFKTKKDIVYLLNRENVCTYEMDDTPPFLINETAIDIGIEIALLLKCQIVNEIHVIRKQYLDGSIPTGFQRTAILGVDGKIPFRGREISIVQLAVEEDSCREVTDERHRITFRTDRLSMPLSETVTGPDMRTPEEVAAVCDLLGRVARVTGHVRRGIGSVRQDVNVSITGGLRVEIKGVSRIPFIPELVHNEALRQSRLLGIREHLRSLALTRENLAGGQHEVREFLAKTSAPLLRKAVNEGLSIRAQVLRGCRKVLLAKTQPGLVFAQELSGRVRVIACLDDPVNLFVRDEPHGLGLARQRWEQAPRDLCAGPSLDEWKRLAKRLHVTEEDGVVLTFGSAEDTLTAANEIRNRMVEALEGVPHETRMPFPSGTTDFERILPGPDRMYPDTDHPPVALKDERFAEIASRLPELPWTREAALKEIGLNGTVIRALAISPHYPLFREFVSRPGGRARAAVLAWLFVELLKFLRRDGVPVETLREADLRYVTELYLSGRLQREGLQIVLTRLARRRVAIAGTREETDRPETVLVAILKEEFPEVAEKKTPLGAPFVDLPRLMETTLRLAFPGEPQRLRTLMGVAMHRYRGVAPGREIGQAVEAWCKKHPDPSAKETLVRLSAQGKKGARKR
ncbi:MAG: Glu-tRNA(Gln) amidotransferase subunit GatE [Pseudomonadota bacterium]